MAGRREKVVEGDGDLCEEVEGSLCQAGAHAVEPEVAAGLAEDGLVILVNLENIYKCVSKIFGCCSSHLLPADAARVDGGRARVGRVEDHRLHNSIQIRLIKINDKARKIFARHLVGRVDGIPAQRPAHGRGRSHRVGGRTHRGHGGRGQAAALQKR